MALVYPVVRSEQFGCAACGRFLTLFGDHLALGYTNELVFRDVRGSALGDPMAIPMPGRVRALIKLPSHEGNLDWLFVAVRGLNSMTFHVLAYENHAIVEKRVFTWRPSWGPDPLYPGPGSGTGSVMSPCAVVRSSPDDPAATRVVAVVPFLGVVIMGRGPGAPFLYQDEHIDALGATWLDATHVALYCTDRDFTAVVRVLQISGRGRHPNKVVKVSDIHESDKLPMLHPKNFSYVPSRHAVVYGSGGAPELAVLVGGSSSSFQKVVRPKFRLKTASGATGEEFQIFAANFFALDATANLFFVHDDTSAWIARVHDTEDTFIVIPLSTDWATVSRGQHFWLGGRATSETGQSTTTRQSAGAAGDDFLLIARTLVLRLHISKGAERAHVVSVESTLPASQIDRVVDLSHSVDAAGASKFLLSGLWRSVERNTLVMERIGRALEFSSWGAVPNTQAVERVWAIPGDLLVISSRTHTKVCKLDLAKMTVEAVEVPQGWTTSEQTLAAGGEWQITPVAIRNASLEFPWPTPIVSAVIKGHGPAATAVLVHTLTADDGVQHEVEVVQLHPRPHQKLVLAALKEAVVATDILESGVPVVCCVLAVRWGDHSVTLPGPASAMSVIRNSAVVGTVDGHVVLVDLETGNKMLQVKFGASDVSVTSIRVNDVEHALISCASQSGLIAVGSPPALAEVIGFSGVLDATEVAGMVVVARRGVGVDVCEPKLSIRRTRFSSAASRPPDMALCFERGDNLVYQFIPPEGNFNGEEGGDRGRLVESEGEFLVFRAGPTELELIQSLSRPAKLLYRPDEAGDPRPLSLHGLSFTRADPSKASGPPTWFDVVVALYCHCPDGDSAHIVTIMMVWHVAGSTPVESPEEFVLQGRLHEAVALSTREDGVARLLLWSNMGLAIAQLRRTDIKGALTLEVVEICAPDRLPLSLARETILGAWTSMGSLVVVCTREGVVLFDVDAVDPVWCVETQPSLSLQGMPLADGSVLVSSSGCLRLLERRKRSGATVLEEVEQWFCRTSVVFWRIVSPDPRQAELLEPMGSLQRALVPTAYMASGQGDISALVLVRDDTLVQDLRALEAAATASAAQSLSGFYSHHPTVIDGHLLWEMFGFSSSRRNELYKRAGLSRERGEAIREAVAAILR